MNAYYALKTGEVGQKTAFNALQKVGAQMVAREKIDCYDEVRKIVERLRTRNLAVAGLPASANM